MGADLVILGFRGGAETGVEGRHLLVAERGEDFLASAFEGGERVGDEGGGIAVVLFLGGGADEEVAPDGAADDDALGDLVRDGQEDVPGKAGGGFVIDDELSLARADGEIGPAQKCGVEVVAKETGGVDDKAGAHGPLRRGEGPVLAVKIAAGDGAGPEQRGPMGQSLGQVGMGGGPRVDEVFAGHAEGRAGAGAEVGFKRVECGAAHRFDIGHAVGMGLVDQGGKGGLFIRCPGDDEGARRIERQAESVVDGEVFGVTCAMQCCSSEPGGASNPVWRIAELALEAPSSMSGAFSSRATLAPAMASARVTAQPTDARADHDRVQRSVKGGAGHRLPCVKTVEIPRKLAPCCPFSQCRVVRDMKSVDLA